MEPIVEPTEKASVRKVVRDQRKTILIALGLAVASYWIIGQLGEWRLATCLAIGIALGLANHLATEFWLLRIITSGDQPSRAQLRARHRRPAVRPDRRRGRPRGLALAGRCGPAARPGHLPAAGPDDDQRHPPEGAEERMTDQPSTARTWSTWSIASLGVFVAAIVIGSVLNLTSDEKRDTDDRDRPPRHRGQRLHDVQPRHDLDHRRRGAGRPAARLPGPAGADPQPRRPRPHQAPAVLGDDRQAGQRPGPGQPRQGPPLRHAAGHLAVLLHPVRQLARAAARPSSTTTRT